MSGLWIPGAAGPLEELSADPGFGFVTVRPYPRDEPPAELIVPIGAIRRIELSRAAEEDAALGFSVRSD